MSDYISRDELLKCQFEFYSHGTHCYEKAVYADVIKTLPAADVVEVRHGEWLWFEDCSNGGLYCSVCHKLIHKVMTPKKKLSRYCPNCGAKMKGE